MKIKYFDLNKILNIYIKNVIMSKQINIEELKTLIAKEIRLKNLNQALPDDAVEKIKKQNFINKRPW